MAVGGMPVARKGSGWVGKALAGLVGVALAGLALKFYGVAVRNYSHLDPAHYGNLWKAHWWLVAHLGGGSLALLLGPFQFVPWIRRRHVKVHRWMGRLYLAGVALASVAAAYMGLWVTPDRAFGVSLLFLDLAWVVTTGMAYTAVLRRQFATHREWMIRSYVVTFAFVLFRWMAIDLNLFSGLGDSQEAMLVWIAWAVPLLGAEVVLNWRRTVGVAKRA